MPAKKLVIFGCYRDDDLYSRNRVLVGALSSCFDEAEKVRPERLGIKGSNNYAKISGLVSSLKSALEYLKEIVSLLGQREKLQDASCVFVPYPAYFDRLVLAWLLPRKWRSLIVVDAFLCLHDTIVNDRRIAKPGSIRARFVEYLEQATLESADVVLIDTEMQKAHLVKQYSISANKILVVPAGINEEMWMPIEAPKLTSRIEVLFYGTFIPLHGVETIVTAAQILEDMGENFRITLVGTGQTADVVASDLKARAISSIEWRREVLDQKEVQAMVKSSHCVLGVFGDSRKAGNVIPYKAHQALASNQILITRSGAAMSALTEGREIPGLILIPSNDPRALADAIVRVRKNYSVLRRDCKTNDLYSMKLSSQVILRILRKVGELA
ncbi:MAG: glycosyltransferase [Halioglobus sp.]